VPHCGAALLCNVRIDDNPVSRRNSSLCVHHGESGVVIGTVNQLRSEIMRNCKFVRSGRSPGRCPVARKESRHRLVTAGSPTSSVGKDCMV